MAVLLNLLIAILAGGITKYLLEQFALDSRLALLVGVLVGIVVFLANPVAAL